MKKIVVALLVIVMVALGAVSLVGCEKSLDGTYINEGNNMRTLVIEGDKISLKYVSENKTEVKDEGTFTRYGDVLTTTLTYTEFMKTITITKDGKLSYENGDHPAVYSKLKSTK